ncbi:hypothetical protein [Pseudomonas yamanorum]|uniref:hypothetical protein n=1 Tax=Pseudomonas yamanorum TaxID=515393 RepID=UPI00087C1628|nr:hypothetical protein [Pseudomonas yamanorum]SDU32697.1 hypothetical protein SAMN05216237_4309 [Pseudomonas yamanorum]
MLNNVLKCFEALARLQSGKCIVVPNSSKINLDTVATEANLYRGFIRSSNPKFKLLIDAINKAEHSNKKENSRQSEPLIRQKKEVSRYKDLYEKSLARELNLLAKIKNLESSLTSLSKSNVLDFNKKKL